MPITQPVFQTCRLQCQSHIPDVRSKNLLYDIYGVADVSSHGQQLYARLEIEEWII